MEAVALIQARIAEIQRLSQPRPPAPAASPGSAENFSAALATAVQTQDAAPAAAGKLVNGIPSDLAKFGNGKVPTGSLAAIDARGNKLWGPAAQAFKSMAADAQRAGVSFGINDSYRSFDEQVDMAKRKGLYSQGGLAATPGKSSHGWGMAVDLELNGKAQQWMRSNAGRYGFVEDVKGEPWHWTFKP